MFTLTDPRGVAYAYDSHALLFESRMLRAKLSFDCHGATPDNVTPRALALDPVHMPHRPGMDEVLEVAQHLAPRPQLKYPWQTYRGDWTEEMMLDMDPDATSWDDFFKRQDRAMQEALVVHISNFSLEVVRDMAIVCTAQYLDIPVMLSACFRAIFGNMEQFGPSILLEIPPRAGATGTPFNFRTLTPVPERPRPDEADDDDDAVLPPAKRPSLAV